MFLDRRSVPATESGDAGIDDEEGSASSGPTCPADPLFVDFATPVRP